MNDKEPEREPELSGYFDPSLTVVEVIASGNPHKSRKRISRPV